MSKLQFRIIKLSILISIFAGCYSGQILEPDQLKEGQKVVKILTKDGEQIDFSKDPSGYGVFRNNKIERFNAEEIKRYELDFIEKVYLPDAWSTNDIILVSGIVTSIVIIYLFLLRGYKG